MADLIIKPQNTSGDKLILQDQAGQAVLTTADSGATIANATLTTPTIANLSNLSGTLPSGVDVKTAGGQAMVFLATVTGSNTSALSLDGHFTSAYTHYKYIFSIHGNTSNTDTAFRYRQSTADLTGAHYRYVEAANYHDTNNSTNTDNIQSDWDGTYMRIASGDNTNDSETPTTGELMLFNVLSTGVQKTCHWQTIGYNSPAPTTAVRNWQGAGFHYNTTAVLSGVTFFYDGGNITGTVHLYGIRNS